MSIIHSSVLPILTPDDKKHLPWVDFSTLTAVNMCPRWGVIHAYHGKRFITNARSMPIEAGRAMHDLFAAVRMFELMEYMYERDGSIPAYVRAHGERLFGETRWHEALDYAKINDDYERRLIRFALNILETTGFHDDPSDRKRTQTNLETAAIAYIDMMPKKRFIPYTDETTGFVGVEMHFDLLLDEQFWYNCAERGILFDEMYNASLPDVRFVGKVDGLCHDMLRNGVLQVDENKTGSRIDTVWMDGFTVSHQPTGYNVAASVTLGTDIWDTNMWGIQIPVPKQSMFTNGQARILVNRDEHQYNQWVQWFASTWQTICDYEHRPTDAPMFTHSCSRYFSSCSFIPLCAEGSEQRRSIFENEMISARWSPLESE